VKALTRQWTAAEPEGLPSASSLTLKGKRVALPSITRSARGERVPLSYAQQQLWFLAQMGGGEAYHIPFGLRLTGELDDAALRRALDRVLARHETLRACFPSVDGQPVQKITPAKDSSFLLLDHDLREHGDAQAEMKRLIKQESRASFDLEAGPLVRGRLIRQAEDEHTLLINMHHIVSDGWSTGVFLNELSTLYGAYLRGEDDPLPELAVQYADYAVWQWQWIEGEILQKQAEYWKTTLAGAPELLELPADHPRPVQQDYAGDFVGLVLDGELKAGLKGLGRRHGTTLYMTLLAGWAAFLARLSGQQDVVIGTPVANRGRVEIKNLIGFFMNTLVLRVDVSGAVTVSELLARIKSQALAAQQHQDIPFGQVVELTRPVRNLSHNPLFQVMFAWQNTPAGMPVLPGLEAKLLESAAYRVAKFDLTLLLQEAGETIVGGLEYATSLFERSTVERYADHLRTLLKAMVEGDDQEVNGLPLLSEAEQHRMLNGWNDTKVE